MHGPSDLMRNVSARFSRFCFLQPSPSPWPILSYTSATQINNLCLGEAIAPCPIIRPSRHRRSWAHMHHFLSNHLNISCRDHSRPTTWTRSRPSVCSWVSSVWIVDSSGGRLFGILMQAILGVGMVPVKVMGAWVLLGLWFDSSWGGREKIWRGRFSWKWRVRA